MMSRIFTSLACCASSTTKNMLRISDFTLPKEHNTRVFAGVTHWIERDSLDSFVSRGQQALSMDKEENLGKRISDRPN
jgi:hypothetical protein